MEENTLSLPQCKEYLINIRSLEISCYEQKKLLKKLKKRRTSLDMNISALENAQDEIPEKPASMASDIILGIISSLFCSFIGAFFGLIGGVAYGVISGVLGIISHGGLSGFRFTHLIVWAIVGYIIVFVVILYSIIVGGRRDRIEYSEKLIEIERARQNREAIKEYKKNQMVTLLSTINESKRELQETQDLLDKYYSLDIIYPKYRALVPISSICEYLESGRCFSLIGPDGAYNLYESELRSNLVVNKLDDISSKLDNLSVGQRMLANVINESSKKVDMLSSSLDRIEGSMELNTYYNQITAENTNYLSWLETWDHIIR